MSIFKESFKKYVRDQIALREAIISQGNKINQGVIQSRNYLTNADPKVIKQLNLPTNKIDYGSFFTYTANRSCVIRMSSGVDLLPTADILEDTKYERLKDLQGPGLATRYVLEGGVPIKNVDFVKTNEKGDTKRDYSKYKHSTRGLHLKKGSFGKHYSATYGDPYIRSDAKDDYGIVPMPGITSCTVRTKSAYGSLREAKVEFVVHNKRQLEIMELLYMRPGFPILIEWGWSLYINNEGKRESYFPQIPDFWKEGASQNLINSRILQNKELTSGNYDGFLGMCKNFTFKARPDGGFDCTTEVIGQGEIIESLKGTRSGKMKTIKEGEEEEVVEVDDFEYWLYALLLWCDTQSQRKGSSTYLNNNYEAVDLYVTLLRYVQKKFKVASGTGAGEFSLGADEYMKKVEEAKAALKEEESNFGDVEPGVTMDDLASKNPGLSDDYRLLEKYLDEFLIFKGENFFSGNSNSTSGSNYVRWDFLVELLNEKVIDQVGDSANSEKPEGIARITVRGYPDNKPLLYTKYKFKNVKNQTFKVTSDELGATVDAELDKIIDMCIDPNIALLPHQINKVSSAELIEFEDNDKNKREIGRIYLSLDFLNKTYRQMRYNDEGLAPDFNMFKYLKKVWDSVSNACAGTHKFILQTEHQRPNTIRVIDLGVSSTDVGELAKTGDMHTLKVQSNETIVRDFNFNSTIPNAMSSTIAIAAQNPDSISDLEASSFAALHTNIQSRFYKEPTVISDATKKKKADKYDQDLQKFYTSLGKLYNYRLDILKGRFQEDDAANSEVKLTDITKSKALAIAKSLESKLISLSTRYAISDEENEEPNFYKGFRRPTHHQSKSEIIPLKFNCQLDGISGIVIGNVFKIDKSRLPEGYQGEDIAFVCMGEQQKITAGQDWTTEISGQIFLLDLGSQDGVLDNIPSFEATTVEVEATGGAPTAGIQNEQARVVPELLELKVGDPVYVKIADDPTAVRWGDQAKFDEGFMIDNETRSNHDNLIGMIPGGGGINMELVDYISNAQSQEGGMGTEEISYIIGNLKNFYTGDSFKLVKANRHRQYGYAGREAKDFLRVPLLDSAGNTIKTPAALKNSEHNEVGKPYLTYRQDYKGEWMGTLMATKQETRFPHDPARTYTTLWYLVKFGRLMYDVVSVCAWAIDGYKKPTFETHPSPHGDEYVGIKQKHGFMYDSSKPDGSEVGGPYLVPDPDSPVKEGDRLYGTYVIKTPSRITGIDHNGTDYGPRFDENGMARGESGKFDDPGINDWVNDFTGWVEISVLDVAPNEAQYLHDKNNPVYPDADFKQIDSSMTMGYIRQHNPVEYLKIIDAIESHAALGFGGDASFGSHISMGYSTWNSFRKDREEIDEYYPFWISGPKDGRAGPSAIDQTKTYAEWQWTDWDKNPTPIGEVSGALRDAIQESLDKWNWGDNGDWNNPRDFIEFSLDSYYIDNYHPFLSNEKNNENYWGQPAGSGGGLPIVDVNAEEYTPERMGNLRVTGLEFVFDKMTPYEVAMWNTIAVRCVINNKGRLKGQWA